jgi:hypothetical protein
VRSEHEAAWLETLVWPGQDARVERLRAAIGIARRNPPNVVRGDLLTDLAELATKAPKEATLVVFHTAVLGYVRSQSARDRFAEGIKEIGVEWISNEAPDVFPYRKERAGVARERPVSDRQKRYAHRLERAARTIARLVRRAMMAGRRCRPGNPAREVNLTPR